MSRLYVGNVSKNGKIEELRTLFEGCGKLKSFNVKESGYIEYETNAEADEAINKLNKTDFYGEQLIVEPSRKTQPRNQNRYNRNNYISRPFRRRSPSDSSSYDSRKKKSNHHNSRSRSRSRSRSQRRSKHHRRHRRSRHSRSD